MKWELPALGAVFSLLLMLPLIIKWKLPKQTALAGGALIAITAAIPFFWIYPLYQTYWRLGIAFLAQIGVALGLAVFLMLLRFWRDPERVPPNQAGVILSAADGKVLYIKTVDEGLTPLVTKNGQDYLLKELTGSNSLASAAYVIGVEMSFLDVHVNRCPIDGHVSMLKHIDGKFISLGKQESPFVNERHTTIIENLFLSVVVVQVASRLVRRVESYLREGDKVGVGQRLGVIKLGSLVAVVLPMRDDVRIEVQPGDRVTAGVTVLARYQPGEEGGV